jgi:hypothetical protein
MIEGERKRKNDDRTEHDPCENNECKDTLEKSVWYRDIKLQGCVMQSDMYIFTKKKSKFLSFFFVLRDEWSHKCKLKRKIDKMIMSKNVK